MLVNQIKTKEHQPTKSGWYDTDEGNLFWFNSEKQWSCREDHVSEEYPKLWYKPIDVEQLAFQSDKQWAVAMENGQIYLNTISWTRQSAIAKFMENMDAKYNWRYFKRKYGIHCKKITANFSNGWQ